MAALPDMMWAIDPTDVGGPEILQPVRRPLPHPTMGEVLIHVVAAGVNRPDILQRRGFYPPPRGAPSIPGLEVAGKIVALGVGVDPELLGQPVCALLAGGGYAEYALAPIVQCLPVPPALTMIEAAALPETLFTVWTNVFDRAYVVEGDTVLVHGGTSGIGTMAIALGKLFGLKVITTSGSDAKCDAARALGADLAINYNRQDFVESVRDFTDGQGCQAVLDMVGGDYVPRNLKCLGEDGRHVSIAVQRGITAELNIGMIMQKRLVLTGSTLRARSVDYKGLVADEISRTVWPYAHSGALKPALDNVFPLSEAGAAQARMEAGQHIGKIVLVTG